MKNVIGSFSSRDGSFVRSYPWKLEVILYVMSGIVLGAVIVKSPYAAIFAIFALFLFLVLSKTPLKALSVLVLMIPFSGMSFFTMNIVGIPGGKPIMFLAFFVVFVALLNYEQSTRMPRYALWFTVAFVSVFTIAILHSLLYLDNYNMRMLSEGKEEFSAFGYILQNYVRPLIYFSPLIVIIKFSKKFSDLEFIMNTMVVSLLGLAVGVLYLYTFKLPKGNVAMANEIFGAGLGMHRNGMANFFIIGFPAILARFFIKKSVFNIVAICMTVAAVGFLFSRTAYVVLVLSFLFYLLVSKRTKYLPFLFAIGIGVSFVVSSDIISRASKGLDSGDRNQISAGRTDNTWLPLVEEYAQNPKKLLVGNGRYAIVSSQSVTEGFTPDDFWHPHNMYLEMVMDAGMVGFVVVVPMFVMIFRKIYRNIPNVQDLKIREYHYAVIVSMISYFVAGITGRSLFPGMKNSYLWIIMGIGIALLEISKLSKEENT